MRSLNFAALFDLQEFDILISQELRPRWFENMVATFFDQFDWLLRSRDNNAITCFKQSGNFQTSFYVYFLSIDESQYLLPIQSYLVHIFMDLLIDYVNKEHF